MAELLMVVAIISTATAVLFPVLRSAKGAARQYQAMSAVRQLGVTTFLYASDADDTYPLAMQRSPEGFRSWFGLRKEDGTINSAEGALSGYLPDKRLTDPSHEGALDYLGDQSGFGYNWTSLGSDMGETQDFSTFPDCYNPARTSELQAPSDTITFATSQYFRAPWEQGGDGKVYDFGFISPPELWKGNPNIAFRHLGERKIDLEKKQVTYTGNALAVFADGSTRTLKQRDVTDKMFTRQSNSKPHEPKGKMAQWLTE